MKVLFITRKWSQTVGGMETYSTELAAALPSVCELTCLAPRPHTPIRALQLLDVGWASIRHIRADTPYDIIHLADAMLVSLSFRLRRRYPAVPIVATVHGKDITFEDAPSLAGRLYRIFCKKIRRAPIDAFISNSKFTTEQTRQRFRHPVFEIPLAGRPPCGPLPLPQNRNLLLYVGRIAPRKGVDWFVEHVLPFFPDVKLILTGRNYLPRSRFEWLRRHPQVNYTPVERGVVPAKIRQQAFACIVPNRASPTWDPEGFGIVAVEHAFTGRPTLATAIQGLTSAVLDGTTGFLLPPDPKAWVNQLRAIQSWSQSEFQRFADRCISHTAAHFTWERVARETVSVYQTLCSKRDHAIHSNLVDARGSATKPFRERLKPS